MESFREYERIKVGDRVLSKRFAIALEQLSSEPEASIHKACGKASQSKAVYRMLSNEKLTQEAIVETHREITLEKIRKSSARVILVAQDTTEVNYSNLKKTKGLGNIGSDPKLKGLLVHSAIAVSPQGQVYGLMHQKIWIRPPEEHGKKVKRKQTSIEQKESNRWLETMGKAGSGDVEGAMLVHMCDREGDIYEFFDKAQREGHLYLCRRIHNRKTMDGQDIAMHLDEQVSSGTYEVEVPRDSHTRREQRTATVEVRYGQVEIKRPQNISKVCGVSDRLPVYVISAKEINVLEGVEAINWQLISNMPVTNYETAKQYIGWYSMRWKIEMFHYTLKSGCAIEKLQYDEAERLSKLIGIYSIIAMRIMWMTYLSRTDPDISCESELAETEWKILYCMAKRTNIAPEKPPTIHEAVILIAMLGGFSGYKSSGSPGVKAMWWGMSKFTTILDALSFANGFVG